MGIYEIGNEASLFGHVLLLSGFFLPLNLHGWAS
jgi:hypothetical protein